MEISSAVRWDDMLFSCDGIDLSSLRVRLGAPGAFVAPCQIRRDAFLPKWFFVPRGTPGFKGFVAFCPSSLFDCVFLSNGAVLRGTKRLSAFFVSLSSLSFVFNDGNNALEVAAFHKYARFG